MKVIHFLIFSLVLLVSSCNKDDDNTPENPSDALPPATQTGEQTFGCLIDGNPFFPGRFGGDRPSAFYQFVRGAYTLGISASRDTGGGENFISIGLGALDIEGLEEGSYPLNERNSGSFHGTYLLGGGLL